MNALSKQVPAVPMHGIAQEQASRPDDCLMAAVSRWRQTTVLVKLYWDGCRFLA